MDEIKLDFENFNNLYQKNQIIFLGLFGSFSKKTATHKSDVDLLVKFSEQKSLMDLVRIQREFEQQLGRKVDLVTENSISPYMKQNILSNLKIIYEKNE